jgi:hypothetical protein
MVHACAALPILEPDDDIDEFAARDRRRVADDRDEAAPPARLRLPDHRRRASRYPHILRCAARPKPGLVPWRRTPQRQIADVVGSWVVAQLELPIIFEFCCKKMASLLRAL